MSACETTARWHDVGDISTLSAEEPISTTVAGEPVGVFLVAGRCHAIHDVCPHEYVRLSHGYVDNGIVECPLHEARFDLQSGNCLGGPTDLPVKVYEVKVDGSRVLVKL